MKIKANPAQCEELYKARTASNKKQLKKLVFSQIRTANRLQGSAKLGVRNITNPDNENYGVLYDKRTRVDLDDGRQATVVVAKPVTDTKFDLTFCHESGEIIKRTPVKTVIKPVAKAAPRAFVAPIAIPGMSSVRTAKHTIEVRTTIDGVRKRLGFASSEKAKAAAIEAAKG